MPGSPQEGSLTDAVVAATIVLALPDGPDSVTIKVEPGVANGDTVEVMEGSSKEIPELISFRIEWLDLLAVQGTLKSLLRHHSSKA